MRTRPTLKAARSSPLGGLQHHIKQRSRRFAKSERGNVLPMVAFAMPVLIGFVGVALDMGSWFLVHEKMQNAADSAAIAAGRAYAANNAADLTSQATAVAATYDFTTAGGATITVNRGPASGTYAGDASKVEVIIQQSQPRAFSSIFTNQAVTIRARAVASANPAALCLVALNATAQNALGLSGGASISAPTCDVKVNSNHSKALSGSGGSTLLTAKNVYVNGGESLSGGATVSVTGVNKTNAGPVADPYASATIPTASGCSQTNYSTNATVTLNPGVYCGGINISSTGNVTLNAGVYYIDRGSLTVSGGAHLSCTGCTIVLTSTTGSNYPTVSISGGSIINMSAPTSGTTANFAFMGDRNMPVGTAATFSGGSGMNITGVIYIPKAKVTYSGGSGGSTNCTKFVADTFTFSGSSTFSGVCTDYPGEAARSPITLVE